MSAHAPGPWHVIQYPHALGDLWLAIGWTEPGRGSVGPICDIVAECKYLVTLPETQWANARLIAAAPAMDLCLALLSRGVARIERTSSLTEFCCCGIRYGLNGNWSWSHIVDLIGWDRARAAIARAGGR